MTWTSKTSKIAPPPYDVRFNGGNTCLTDATGRIFAYCPEPETASLLAAAPDLLAACRALVATLDQAVSLTPLTRATSDAMVVAWAAIEKATGSEP